ncbi:LLM class flavin-dependent oxidoreductase [Novosphingobium malaysiense]|uniref:LLM class flavin-dependent oxidoreductase n=1 Tax=Novosphingobium malaysiense TaxID=1348853 RepID=UPI00068BED61|nr:LLM class flavin-dependent oxidoreductase [Novosphingobium malaysiense]
MPTAMELTFDLRVPRWAPSTTTEIYQAAVDMCEWADAAGFQAMTIGEHHTTEDQYITSPLMFATAVGARTSKLQLRMIILAPFYNPLRLAEDLAVLNLLTDGRAVPVISAGMRDAEFDMYGLRREDRPAVVEETVEVLRKAWSGKPFRYRGRDIEIVSPVPDKTPRLLMGASWPKMIRKAAAIADGLSPAEAGLYELFRAERRKLGKPDPGEFPNQSASFIHITEDPEGDWEKLFPYWAHGPRIYQKWAEEIGKPVNEKFPAVESVEQMRKVPVFRVFTPDESLEYAQSLGPNGELRFRPLAGGMPPELGWASLKLFEKKVLPHLDVRFTPNIHY